MSMGAGAARATSGDSGYGFEALRSWRREGSRPRPNRGRCSPRDAGPPPRSIPDIDDRQARSRERLIELRDVRDVVGECPRDDLTPRLRLIVSPLLVADL